MTQKIEGSAAWQWIRQRQKSDERVNELFDTIGKMMYLEELLSEYALASHAPSEGRPNPDNFIPSEWSEAIAVKPSEAAAQPTRSKQVPEETISDEIRLGKRKLCGHIAPCDCQNGIFQAEIEHNDH